MTRIVAKPMIWPPRITLFRSNTGCQVTFSPLMTNTPTGFDRMTTPAPPPDSGPSAQCPRAPDPSAASAPAVDPESDPAVDPPPMDPPVDPHPQPWHRQLAPLDRTTGTIVVSPETMGAPTTVFAVITSRSRAQMSPGRAALSADPVIMIAFLAPGRIPRTILHRKQPSAGTTISGNNHQREQPSAGTTISGTGTTDRRHWDPTRSALAPTDP